MVADGGEARGDVQQKPKKGTFGVSASFGATLFMAVYMSMAMLNLYKLMFPLAMVDLSHYQNPQDFVHPLWKASREPSSVEMHMRVYLSTSPSFSLQFLASEDFPSEKNDDNSPNATSSGYSTLSHVMLWDQILDSASLSKSFLLTNFEDSSDDACITDPSYQFAINWINRTERMLLAAGRDGDILSQLSAASGHGVESTSFLLSLYQALSRRIRLIVQYFTSELKTDDKNDTVISGLEGYTRIFIPQKAPIWSALQSNSTLFLHVLVIRTAPVNGILDWPPKSFEEAKQSIQKASNTYSLLMGKVNMIKYDLPNHIGHPRRILYHDVTYYWNRYVLGSREMPPWVMAIYKPEEFISYQKALEWKKKGMGYPYWKPEVSIKFVNDEDSYPVDYAHMSGMPLVAVRGRSAGGIQHPTGHAFMPALHVDEMGMTSEKYIPVNDTVTSLPLRITFDRNDMEHRRVTTTATAGGISPARWRLLTHLSQAIEKQKELGFDESDIDDLKRLIADTNITLLAITMLASALHLLFEFLTFKSEVSFWKKNKDLTGLSVRSLFLDLVGQTVILFYLIEQQSSLLTTVPSGIGCLIALWKCERAAGLRFMKMNSHSGSTISWYNWIPAKLIGYELRATRLEGRARINDESNEMKSKSEQAKDRLVAMSIEADRLATKYLGAVLLPLAWGYAIYSLVYKEHKSWYSWMITSLASTVYALGFVLMTPQLFLNWKMKSVAHLPWRVLVYKSLNTFIDDLFSFIIRMPTMARISCFRDDVVFFIYLYQRWLYPVDSSRPVEGGGDDVPTSENETHTSTARSKKID
jgi:Cleft lip and palate transmembrane protein 1 (CLPTM1)